MDIIDEMRVLLKKITPGPWRYDGMHNEITTPRGEFYWLIVSECRPAPDQAYHEDEFGHQYDANFDFIARAPDGVRALLDRQIVLDNEIAVTNAENAKLRSAVEELRWTLDGVRSDIVTVPANELQEFIAKKLKEMADDAN
jgi:hypothetical protein